MNLSSRKFERLQLKQQHKKCALLLRTIYEKILHKKEIYKEEKEIYEKYLQWMKLEISPLKAHLKDLSNRYHWHLTKANMELKEHNLLPHIRKGDHLPKKDFSNITIYLDNIRSANNVGSILRTTEALRIGSLYFGGNTPFIDNSKVVKTSMGASSIVSCRAKVEKRNLPRPFIALETSFNAMPIADVIFPEKFTLLIGNEEFGISDELLAEADFLIEIPLFGIKNSINVACAYAIAAAEIRRQHNLAGL